MGILDKVFGFGKKSQEEEPVEIFNLSFTNIHGEEVSLASFKGKYLLFVNVASKCGYTKQYADLRDFQEQYKDKVQVLAFPCNQFGEQEPGTEEEIYAFCSSNYDVNFPLSEKVKVKGSNAHPVYQWLTNKAMNKKISTEVEWNFQKYLVGPDGEFLGVFYSATSPLDPKIKRFLK